MRYHHSSAVMMKLPLSTPQPMQGRSQKSGEGGAAVLFDIARIRKGVLEPLVCA